MQRFSWLLWPTLTVTLCWCSALSAASPTVGELVLMMQRYHPEYLAQQARTEQIGSERDQADAAFDLRLVQDTYARTSGYYDGTYLEQQIVQPLASMNAQVFGRYRLADGDFPIYEAEYQTLDKGEASLGVKLSLLQNRETDKRRLAQVSAAWRLMEAESKQLANLNKLIYQGVSAYLDWHQSHQKLAVVNDLLALTQARLGGIKARVSSGDLAQINLTEFETTLVRRQLLEQEALQHFRLAQQQLSYFWRTADAVSYQGNSISTPPGDIGWPFSVNTTRQTNSEAFSEAINGHPAVEALAAKIEQARNKRQLAENETLPQLDLEFKVARDLGDGIEALTGNESVLGLSFFMPVGQRAAKARQAGANAEIRALEYDQQVLKEQLRRDVDLSLNALDYARDILALSQQQESLAETLLAQERARFEEGVSDQFLLITRETTALQARLKTIDAEIEVRRHELALHATLARLHNDT